MIRGGGAPPAEPRLRAVFDALHALPEPFDPDPLRAGLDVRCGNEVHGARNRARIKAFAPDANVLVVFVYKDSQVPFSDDRFSYGAALIKGAVDPRLVTAVADFAVSGLDPARRPKEIRKTFQYTVPK